MRTLLIDNHDSYTYNLFQLMAEVYEKPPVVLTNDDPRWADLDLDDFDAIVVSPGPGHPGRERDLGAARTAMATTTVPLLGVCLGHQAIAMLSGAEVVGAPRPRHGHLTRVRHTGEDLFDGVPQDFVAVRYHSLCVPADRLPPDIEATAWAEDGVLMGIRHRSRPLWGVQFHPESISSEHGARLVENFGRLAGKVAAERGRGMRGAGRSGFGPVAADQSRTHAVTAPRNPWRALHRRLDHEVDTAAAFIELFADREHAFWLDSSRAEPGLSRFSFLGAPDGPDGEVLTYRLDTGLAVRTPDGTRTSRESVFDALRERLAEPVSDPPDVPFDLMGGYVGYFGYELKAQLGSPNRHTATTPDAVWLAATRLVVVDHEEHTTHLLALTRSADDPDATAWLDDTEHVLARVRPADTEGHGVELVEALDPEPGLVRARRDYLADIQECQRQLHAGESYEICLTTQSRLDAPDVDPLRLYLAQRRANPAPYAAFLRLGELVVLCSSPERFLRIERDRTVETKPIKGTTPRDPDPRRDAEQRSRLTHDPKVFAENLMIVDLLRNDLGRVCEVGSVSVPRFMAVESYATVHQLVSTVRGRLRADTDLIDCVRACFPGGSMTGAPKLRTMEIIDQLEVTARGVYSGALGFVSRNGTADLNIVIRTAVAHRGTLTVGAGGAIVLDSDPQEEFAEMLLKARTPLHSLSRRAATTDSGKASR
ncbi:aminodeoxychorismate synthase component I [Saccharothrix deserti]|uniref:aminodeoxychorismate synthase component I n=1 Tax=Saccharothrix deserti TaxID=2593674 RepID=UPI00131E0074|nr:aminodeoxychorismate synthase component I [Saccharothrix deserti]